MPTTMVLGVDNATFLIAIGAKTYTLVSEPLSISIPGRPEDQRFHFRYKESPQDPAIDLGTPDEVLRTLQDALAPLAAFLPANATFVDEWNKFMAALKATPVFDQMIGTVATTNVRITEIEVLLARRMENNAPVYDGKLRFGLMFTPQQPPRLFNIRLNGFGATFSVKVTGLEQSKLTGA